MSVLTNIFGVSPPPAVQTALPALRYRNGALAPCSERVAAETAVALIYNGTPHAVMMASPADLQAFGIGFTVTERIVASREEIRGVRSRALAEGVELHIEIDAARHRELARRQRVLTGRVGCGVCGQQTLAQAVYEPAPVPRTMRIDADAVRLALAELPAWQAINRETGALHAAAWAKPDGGILVVREDVGRHNAFDKLIGSLLGDRVDFGAGFAIITSRASHEMVQKAAVVGMQVLVAVSAPTALAVKLAQATGMTLIAFARNGRYTVYTGAERIRCEVATVQPLA